MNIALLSTNEARNEVQRNRLDLFSVRRFEALLCLPMDRIEGIANRAGALYSPFIKPPPKRWFPKKPQATKIRLIDNPNEQLKAVQKRILSRMLEPVGLPSHVKGGVKGRALRDNIELHLNQHVLVTLDIKSFFPSINPRHVFFIWRRLLNCSPRFSSILTRLTTFERRLPQGAPTSTYLANLLITSIDHEICVACATEGVLYSTWVDDLAFSGPNAPLVIQTAVSVLQQAGFAVSHRKLKVMRPGSRKILNGIVVGRNLNVPLKYRNDLRSGIHKMRRGLIDRATFESYVSSMNGKIDHISRFNSKLAERLREEFRAEVAGGRKRLIILT